MYNRVLSFNSEYIHFLTNAQFSSSKYFNAIRGEILKLNKADDIFEKPFANGCSD